MLTFNLKAAESVIRQVILTTLVYLILPVQALSPVTDLDIWWHLRTGQWIAAHGGVPYRDYFSAFGYGKPWIAYSWLFELCIYLLHARFGLAGIVWFTVAMALLITFAVHQLIRLARLPIALEISLTGLVVAALSPLMTPRPWLFTLLFFVIELLMLRCAREKGKDRWLWFLPALFVVWTNLHVQFVYGLAVLVFMLAEAAMYELKGPALRLPLVPTCLSTKRLAPVTLACFLATLVSPYHVLIFRPIWEYVHQTGAFQNISELSPMFFRSPADWIVLFLTVAAAFALGWERKWSPFLTLLFIFGVFLGFRARRDVWIVVFAASWIIGRCLDGRWPERVYGYTQLAVVTIAGLILAPLLLLAVQRQINERSLQAAVAKEFPVDAVDYVKRNKLRGPIFNSLNWGGFLIWALPELPVAIDGRTNLHGDKRLASLLGVWQGQTGWDANPELRNANLIIADHGWPLSSLLTSDPRYRIVHEDRTAIVFIPSSAHFRPMQTTR